LSHNKYLSRQLLIALEIHDNITPYNDGIFSYKGAADILTPFVYEFFNLLGSLVK
jgi:hypothetical protein